MVRFEAGDFSLFFSSGVLDGGEEDVLPSLSDWGVFALAGLTAE